MNRNNENIRVKNSKTNYIRVTNEDKRGDVIMRMIKLTFAIIISVLLNSCVYTNYPFTYKLTRGNWENDTTQLIFNDLPELVKDTLSSYYQKYYAKDSVFYSELISLNKDVDACFINYNTFPTEKLFQVTGYFFKIGKQKYFFDYHKYRTPIVYYENCLYYFSGEYYVKKDRYTFEAQSDYENKIFVKYNLKKSHLKKHKKNIKGKCSKESDYDYINKTPLQ